MNTLRKYFTFLMLALGLSVQCFAVQSLKSFAVQSLKMDYDQSQTCDNYYIQPGGVYVAPNGIFILFEGQLVQVGMLCSDERGVFVPGSEMTRQFVWCSICQRWYDPDKPHNCK